MEYKDLNPVSPGKKRKLKRQCHEYVKAVLSLSKEKSPEKKTALLEEWYNNTLIYPIHYMDVLHHLQCRSDAPLLKLLILQVEIHEICQEVGQKIQAVFPDQFKRQGTDLPKIQKEIQKMIEYLSRV